jgi:2-amino-4-hydroxy-6-hydroxymethyldihydropteridine diphosphokinase
MNRAYLSLGSNIEPERNLPAAVRALGGCGRVLRVSSVWETPPVGYADQPNFLNAAVLLDTPLSAEQLCRGPLAEIERALGRVRDPANSNAPRTIDIDLALFNRDVLRVDHRRIPDPDLLTRAFVAVPLAELDPGYVHPEVEQTLATIAAGFAQERSTLIRRSDVVLV